MTEVVYAYQNYAELSTKVAIDLVSSLYGYESNKIFIDLNEEAIEILEEIRKNVHKIELEEV